MKKLIMFALFLFSFSVMAASHCVIRPLNQNDLNKLGKIASPDSSFAIYTVKNKKLERRIKVRTILAHRIWDDLILRAENNTCATSSITARHCQVIREFGTYHVKRVGVRISSVKFALASTDRDLERLQEKGLCF